MSAPVSLELQEGEARGSAAALQRVNAPLLAVRDLEVFFRHGRDWLRVVEGTSFEVARGETIGIVGESGSGKTVTGLSILGLLPEGLARTQGSIRLDGREINGLPESEMRAIRGRKVSMIFQEPMTALDPVFTVGEQIGETLRTHTGCSIREGARPCHRGADAGRHSAAGAAHQRVSASVVGRHAPAGDDRHCSCLRAGAC